MILLSQAYPSLKDRYGDDIAYVTRAAIAEGWTPFFLPYRLDEKSDLDEILAPLPESTAPQPVVWFGVVPSLALYTKLYEALRARRYLLLNTPEEHQRVFELDLAYPRLAELTARTAVIRSVGAIDAALAEVPLPVFVKGSLASRKEAGWKACVAETREELESLVASLLGDEQAARGRVVIRELLPLRTERVEVKDFPIAREYRFFLYRGEILSWGFYWLYLTLFPPLLPDEEQEMCALVVEAARRLEVPFVSIDVAQKRDGSFVIVEPGDPQFSGPSMMPLQPLWRRLASLLAR